LFGDCVINRESALVATDFVATGNEPHVTRAREIDTGRIRPDLDVRQEFFSVMMATAASAGDMSHTVHAHAAIANEIAIRGPESRIVASANSAEECPVASARKKNGVAAIRGGAAGNVGDAVGVEQH
jgi:hypothetical protein